MQVQKKEGPEGPSFFVIYGTAGLEQFGGSEEEVRFLSSRF